MKMPIVILLAIIAAVVALSGCLTTVPDCVNNSDCNDHKECTLDSCSQGECKYANAPDGAACSEGSCSNGDCVPAETQDFCRKILGTGQPEESIDFFFMSEDFSNSQSTGFEQLVSQYASDSEMFSIEPFKSTKGQANVFEVFMPSYDFNCASFSNQPGVATCIRSEINRIIGELCFNSPESAVLDSNKPIIITLGRAYTGNPITKEDSGIIALPTSELRTGSLLHELGHSIGNFGEEYTDVYVPQPRISYPFNLDGEGCPKWCSGDLNEESECYATLQEYRDCTTSIASPPEEHVQEWEYCFVTALKKPVPLNVCNLGQNCEQDTACYLGGESISDWKAYPTTIMQGGYNFYSGYGYGKINEDYLRERILEIISQ